MTGTVNAVNSALFLVLLNCTASRLTVERTACNSHSNRILHSVTSELTFLALAVHWLLCSLALGASWIETRSVKWWIWKWGPGDTGVNTYKWYSVGNLLVHPWYILLRGQSLWVGMVGIPTCTVLLKKRLYGYHLFYSICAHNFFLSSSSLTSNSLMMFLLIS